MENYWEKLNYSSSNSHMTNFVGELFNILKKNEIDSFRKTDLYNKSISDDSCAAIDFMLTALYT